jgi:hypothetical protein
MKNLIVVGLALFVLVSVVACSDDTQPASTQSATMQTDTKDMKK